uniref:Short-chain dehydrogenase/reductase family 16C member 6 n=1 Tax=Cacopsylla melanoneura TaxID=428564 RepID=A0A8D8QN39_9HEMI
MNCPFSVLFDSLIFGGEVFYLVLKTILVVILKMIGALFPRKRKSVTGQIVVVTGAGHGIGKELAIQLSELGCIVVCVDLKQENNNKTAEFINMKYNSKRAFPFVMDVSSRDQVMTVSQNIMETVGNVDILINNAGILPAQPILTVNPDEVVEVINVNLLANFWTVLAFLPSMVKRNKGHIVGISSLAGLSGLANKSPYSASKFGIAGKNN